jgi:osmotically-inducible protein OsmY
MSKFGKTILVLALASGVLANLSGCVAIVAGGAVVSAMTLTSDRRTIGSQTEDKTIELKGANRIATTLGDSVHININSYNRKVLLTGEVKDEALKARVEAEIKSVENVQSIINEIQVSTFTSSMSSRSSDALLTTKVKSKLLGTADIYSNSFKVVSESGVVYLMGRVSQREANTAVEAVREISGVQKVVKVFEYIDDGDVNKFQLKSAEEKTKPS